MKNKRKEFSCGYVLKKIGPNTREVLIDNRIRINADTGIMAYSRKNPKQNFIFRKGYDLLQFTIVIKPFIIKLYNIENEILLDVLLYLFPIQYFTNKDYKLLPLLNTGISVKYLKENGYIDYCVERTSKNGKIYVLSERSINLVRDYYKYLSGEKTLRKATTLNPFSDPEATLMDRKREKLMIDIKRRVENMPKQFTKGI